MKKALPVIIIIILIVLAGLLGYFIMARTKKIINSTSLLPNKTTPQISPSGPANLSPDICPARGYPPKSDFLTKYNLSASAGNYFVVQGILTEVDSDHWVVQANPLQQSKGSDVWVQLNTQYVGKQNYKVGDCVTVVVNTVGNSSQKGSQQAVVVASQ